MERASDFGSSHTRGHRFKLTQMPLSGTKTQRFRILEEKRNIRPGLMRKLGCRPLRSLAMWLARNSASTVLTENQSLIPTSTPPPAEKASEFAELLGCAP